MKLKNQIQTTCLLLLALTLSLGCAWPVKAADITPGYTFSSGEQNVTHTKLNNAASGTVNSTFYTGKNAKTTQADADLILIYDPSAAAFRKVTLQTLWTTASELTTTNGVNFRAGGDAYFYGVSVDNRIYVPNNSLDLLTFADSTYGDYLRFSAGRVWPVNNFSGGVQLGSPTNMWAVGWFTNLSVSGGITNTSATAESVPYWDANKKLGSLTIGSGLSLSAGTLSATVSGGGATFDPNQFGTGGGNTNIKSGAVFTNTQNYSLTIRTGESLIFDATSQWQQYANPSSEILTFVNGGGSGMNLTTGGIEPLPSVAYTVGTASLPMTGVYATNGTFSGWMSVAGGFTNGGPAYLNGSVALGNASGDAITLSGTLEGTLQGEPIVSLTDTAIDFDFDKILFRDDNDGGTLKMGVAPAFGGDAGSGGTPGLVPAPAAGDAAALKFLKADGTWATPAGSGTLTSVTNAGNSSYSLINSSNSPVPALKSISAGSNITLTDQGTNIVVAASGGGGSGATFLAVTRGMSSNNTAEATIVSATVTNNTLTTGKTLRVIAHGTYTNASAGAVAITVAVKLGGTTLYTDAAGTVAQSSTPRNWRIEAYIYADSSTSQYMNGLFQLGPNSTADTGLGDAAGTAYLKNALISSLDNTAVDMTSGDKTFEITITQGTASTSAVWITKQATAELLP